MSLGLDQNEFERSAAVPGSCNRFLSRPRAVFGFSRARYGGHCLPSKTRQQNAYAALGDRPLTRNNLYGKAAKDYRLMRVYPWGWIRMNSNALLPFPRAVTGFCPAPGLYSIFPGYNGFGGVYYLLENEALFNYA